jgi:aspartate/methionine/tyrosine aminotransferase
MASLGTENAFTILARAAVLAQEGKNIINLGIGQPDFPTPDHIVEAGVKALRDGHHGYTPANGIKPLREAVAEDISHYRQAKVDPDDIVIVPGGKVTMWNAILMLGEKGTEIMYPNPGFPIYESVIKFSGATPVPIPMLEDNGFNFDVEALLASITPQTRLIIVNSPANPTGGVLPRETMDRLAEGLMEHPHVTIMSDEIYCRLQYTGLDCSPSMLTYEHLRDRLIVLDGWSKTYAMTGWRLGYGVWPKSLAPRAAQLNINSISCTNAAAQWAALAATSGPQNDVTDMNKSFLRRRDLIVNEINTIPGFSCTAPKGAFYAFANIKETGKTSREIESLLLEELGIASVAGTSFGDLGEGYLRFSYASSDDNIKDAMQRIRNHANEKGW